MPLERIVITFNPDGTFRGASAQDFDGLPAALSTKALDAFAPSINTASLARLAELETDVAAKETALADSQAAHAEIEALAASQTDDAAALKEAIIAKAREARQPEVNKEIAALETQIAAESEKLAELKAKAGR